VSVAKNYRGVTAAETHGAVLNLIRSRGEVSRTELADLTGLTATSITRIVRQLLADGLVVETGLGESTGGKRRTLLQLNPGSRHAVGISLNARRITYVLTDLSGQVVARDTAGGIGQSTPQQVVERIAAELKQLLATAGIVGPVLMGVGIAVSGRMDARHHVLRSNPYATDWEEFALEQSLGAATGLPVIIDNDSTCAAIGEFWAGQDARADFAVVYMTTGYGLGLISGGSVYRGASSNTGEIGHVTVDAGGPECICGRTGCLHALARADRLVELALADPSLAGLDLEGTAEAALADYLKIATAAEDGQPAAVALIRQAAAYLASALVSATNLLDLDRIVLAGPGFDRAGALFADLANAVLAEDSYLRKVHGTTVELSGMGTDIAALGAASMVLHAQLTPHLSRQPMESS
jgi:predicted NBD/HSP70 family sugar kinase